LVCVKDNDHNLKAFAQATTPSRLPDFVRNITSFVSRNGYDGVDIDWEANVDVAQYANLLSRLRTAMPQKIITLAVGDWQDLDRVAAESQPRVDQINVMCYDMDNGQNCHGLNCSWHDAALFQAGERDKRTCDHRVNAFTRAGVSPGKIGIGLPFFGRLRSGTDQPEVFGSFPSNTVYFRDLTTDSSRWQKSFTHFDQKFGAEYLSIPKRNEFVSYVGAESIKEAVRWQQKENFGGLMTFALEYEYLQKQSGNARYPLSSVLYGQVVKANSESAKENVQRPKVPSR
ncbi:MAG TPA: glycoside hydrolase family 18 protein, partial [Bryobacteraceae bacterium]|nr:glycoside hydrolase family 18 protein [Bryobacteraceae bacterium]